MSAFWKYLCFLLWISYLLSCGILLFSRGFLLHRQVLKDTATCSHPCNLSNSSQFSQSRNEFCFEEDTYLLPASNVKNICYDINIRVVLVVIDALRFDFMVFNSSLKDSEQFPFQNRMKIIDDLLTSKPKNSRLYKLIADPPTTTLQRLLGLTTGSLPTFIDAGSNFASTEVDEDNIIDQLTLMEKLTVMMGDDTWLRLYPSKFTRAYPFDSFNVWDLDTLDKGVKKHLFPEIKQDDWSLLVAHFVGVDHCGHRFGPYHQEMKRKLTEMNQVLSEVVNAMDNRTILLVIGDHGMTSTGDHGGASDDEVTAALFAYSNFEFYPSSLLSNSVSQVDLVPTLSTLLGTPIPFSNLGALIPNLLPIIPGISIQQFTKRAFWSNVKQISNYVDKYAETNDDLSSASTEEIKKKYEDLNKRFGNPNEDTDLLIQNAHELVSSIRAKFVQIWAKFDEFAMTWGLVMSVLSLVMIYLVIEGLPGDQLAYALSPEFILFTYGNLLVAAVGSWVICQNQSVVSFDVMLFVTSCGCSLFCLMFLFVQNVSYILDRWKNMRWSQAWPDFIYRKIFLLTLLGMTSNSFVVEESSVLFFVLSSVIFLLVFSYKLPKDERKSGSCRRTVDKTTFRWLKAQVHPTRAKLVAVAVILCLILRVSHVFWRCREEQSWCQRASENGEQQSHVLNHDWLSLRMLLCTALWVTTTRMWLRSCGNLTGFSMIVLLIRYVPTVLAVCSGGFWVLHDLPVDTKSQFVRPWQLQYLPLTVYALIIITLIGLTISPLCVYAVPAYNHTAIMLNTHERAIPQLYNQIKRMMRNPDEKSDSKTDDSPGDKPVVYGLATAYSAAFLVVAILFVLLLALLLGTQLAPSAVLLGTSGVFLVGLLALLRFDTALLSAQLINVPWSAVLCWTLLAHYFFYGTGHQATFPSLHWDAAMVGTSGNFAGKHFLPATLVIINTFGSHIFAALMLPVLIVAPLTIRVMIRSLTPAVLDDAEMKLGELMLFQKDFVLYRSLISVCTRYILLLALRVLACMVAATIHTRHLMTWKVFAPKLIFEGLSFLISLPCIILAFLLVGRVTNSIQSLLTRLETQTAQKQK